MSYALTIGFITYGKATAKYLPYFLSSLKTQTFRDFRVLVFDNTEEADNDNIKSLNGAAGAPQSLWGDCGGTFEILRADKNIGFAAAFNKLIRKAEALGAQYFLTLNPDMILEPAAVEKMVNALENDKNLGSVCPKILRWDFDKIPPASPLRRGAIPPTPLAKRGDAPQSSAAPWRDYGEANTLPAPALLMGAKTNIIDSCGIVMRPGLRFFDLGQGEIDNGQYNNAEILGPSGAAAMYRMSALEKIKIYSSAPPCEGGRTSPRFTFAKGSNGAMPPFARGVGGDEKAEYFDELMFMYKEDCDLAYRLFLAGYKSKCAADALVYHDRTAYGKGEGDLQVAFNRKNKSRQVKKWAFLHQQIIFIKYWKLQNFQNKLAIIWYEIRMIGFIILFEQYLLGEFYRLYKMKKRGYPQKFIRK